MSYSLAALLYVALYLPWGVLLPFQPLVLHAVGLPDASIAWILMSTGLAAIGSPVLMAYFADRHLSASILLRLLLVATAISAVAFLFVGTGLGWFLSTFVLGSLFIPTTNLCDTAMLSLLKRGVIAGCTTDHFPRLRVWGSFGFMLPGFTLLLYPQATLTPELFVAALSSAALIAAATFSFLPNVPVEGSLERLPTKAALQLLLKPPVLHVVGALFLIAIALSMLYVLLPRYGEELGLSSAEVGLLINVGVVVELIVLPWLSSESGRAFAVRTLFLLGIGALAVRLIIISVLGDIVAVLLTQTLHAFTVASLFIVTPMYLQRIVAPQYRYSLQGLYVLLNVGVARALGPAIAGGILAVTGTSGLEGCRLVFAFGALLSIVSFLWLAVVRVAEVRDS